MLKTKRKLLIQIKNAEKNMVERKRILERNRESWKEE